MEGLLSMGPTLYCFSPVKVLSNYSSMIIIIFRCVQQLHISSYTITKMTNAEHAMKLSLQQGLPNQIQVI